jgi:hypothetical protein
LMPSCGKGRSIAITAKIAKIAGIGNSQNLQRITRCKTNN